MVIWEEKKGGARPDMIDALVTYLVTDGAGGCIGEWAAPDGSGWLRMAPSAGRAPGIRSSS